MYQNYNWKFIIKIIKLLMIPEVKEEICKFLHTPSIIKHFCNKKLNLNFCCLVCKKPTQFYCADWASDSRRYAHLCFSCFEGSQRGLFSLAENRRQSCYYDKHYNKEI